MILVDNACKYTQRRARLRIEAAMEDGPGATSVFDTGTGIDPGDLPRIFDRFYRGKNATALPAPGLDWPFARWGARTARRHHRGRKRAGRARGFRSAPLAAPGEPAA